MLGRNNILRGVDARASQITQTNGDTGAISSLINKPILQVKAAIEQCATCRSCSPQPAYPTVAKRSGQARGDLEAERGAQAAAEMGNSAAAVAQSQQGATARTVDCLIPWLTITTVSNAA